MRRHQRREVGAGQVRLVAAPLADHRADAGMRVLDVIDRVIAGFRFRQRQIEIQRLVLLAQQVEKTAGIVADFLAQLAGKAEKATPQE